MSSPLFAVERYDATGSLKSTTDWFPALPPTVRLAGAFHLPADEVVIAFVEGEDEASVVAAMAVAGWRVDRISPADRFSR